MCNSVVCYLLACERIYLKMTNSIEPPNIGKWQSLHPEAKLVQWESCPQRGSVGIMSIKDGYLVVVDEQYVCCRLDTFKDANKAVNQIWAEKSKRVEKNE